MTKSHAPGFGFYIKWGEYGYYINLNRCSGQPMHIGHPRPISQHLISLPTRFMSEEMKYDARHAMDTLSRKAAGRNFIFGKFGKYVNTIKIAYLASSQKYKGKCDIASMLETFQASDDIRFTCLSDIPVGDFVDNDDTTVSLESKTTITVSLSKKEKKIVRKNVRDSKALAPIEKIRS